MFAALLLALVSPAPAGATDGAQLVLETVAADATDVYRVDFTGERLASATLIANPATTLGLEIVDEHGNPIAKDLDVRGRTTLGWIPARDGTFLLKVHGAEEGADYVLSTN